MQDFSISRWFGIRVQIVYKKNFFFLMYLAHKDRAYNICTYTLYLYFIFF